MRGEGIKALSLSHHIHTCAPTTQNHDTHQAHCRMGEKGGDGNIIGGGLAQSTLSTCMELS
jgi:hypothetical protein